jgi:hypothetical protein
MSTVIDKLSESKKLWQGSFNGELTVGKGYRGDLIIEEGKFISADKQMPPKSVVRQVIAVADGEQFNYFAGELESLELFDPLMEAYEEYFKDGIYTLFIIDLDKDIKFEYKGKTFYAFVLDESSVWNESLEHADLSKGDLKKLKSNEKIDELYSAIKQTSFRIAQGSYEEFKALKSDAGKLVFGAV